MRCGVFLFFLISCTPKYHLIKHQDNKPIISMERTACYGPCPQYIITIYNDGLIQYEGKLFVDKKGCFYSKISKKQIDNVISKFNDYDFFSFENEYDALMTDVPSVILEVNFGSQNHQVIDRFNGPNDLKKLQNSIDFISNSVKKWNHCK